jgi:hypothetical protein
MNILNLCAVMLAALLNTSFSGRNSNFRCNSDDNSVNIIEKVYLHIDRESYYPGDDIWFKAYLIDASDNLLSSNSINLHVELISPDLKIIDSRVIKLNNGLGNGDFRLSDKLKSGRYRVRAYTNYMRNFGDQVFFYKEIAVINSSDAIKAFSDSNNNIMNKLSVTFFPEGGSLVDNVPSIVAFKALNTDGRACDVSGEVFSSAGEIVSKFRSTHKGMGIFSMTPTRGLTYYAVVTSTKGEEVKSEIPLSFSSGVAINISRNKKDELMVTVRTNEETLSQVKEYDLSLRATARNVFLKKADFRVKSLADRFIFPTDDMPEGIILLTLTGPDSIPLCERMVFIQNKDEVKVEVKTEKTEYRQRDSVAVKISLKSDSTNLQDAFLSLSATKNISEKSTSLFPSTISSWFLLESDVRGPIEEPSYYFDISNPDRLKDLDLLLLTQGWRDFKWKYENIYWPPETGFKISGRLTKKFKDVPLKNSNVNIAIFKSGNPVIRIVPTDSTGRFLLEGIDLTGNAKLVASATGEKEQLKGMLHLDSLSYSPAPVSNDISEIMSSVKNDQSEKNDIPEIEYQFFKDNLNAYVQYAEINNSLRKKYKLSDTIAPGEVKIVAIRSSAPESALSKNRRYLKGTPDISIIVTPQLEKYSNVFKMMRATFFYGVRIKNPIFLLDGMPVSGEALAGLPVSWIERVDVSDKMSSYSVWGAGTGDIPIDGVISIITRDGAAPVSKTPVYHSVNINISGYNEPRIFYSPKHHTDLESDYKPDLRTTLLWEPDIKMENNKDVQLNYFNADNSSKVKIVVEGITASGIPVTAKTEYEVK